ncbi:hypothetical protein GCM10010187_10060 [Actinomadura coerulea]|nr:hypothetical protein GCM10010187_10060 [Actinomadura coerulea]
MCAGRNVTTIYFAATAGAVLAGLMLFAPWPLWAAFAATFAIFGLLLFRTRNTRSQPKGGSLPAAFAFAPAPAADVRATRLPDVLLPSESPDYRFQFSAMVMWSPTATETAESETNYAALAVNAILERARGLTELRDPGHASLVQHELAGALGEMQVDSTKRLLARAESVRLALPGPDQERLDKLAEVRKEEAIWEHERKYEQNRRDYLQHDVLKDPGSAVVWWLAKNDDQVDRTVKDIGLLAQLSSAANNAAIPQTFLPFLSQFTAPDDLFTDDLPTMNGAAAAASTGYGEPDQDGFEAFFNAMGFSHSDPRRRLLARQFAELATKHGRQDVAEELIRRYDPPGESDVNEEGWPDGS